MPFVEGAGSSAAVSCSPQVDSSAASATDAWSSFLQCYESFIAFDLAQEHAPFARDLRLLERAARLEHERHSAQVLATLRVKDAKICELQTLVREQREQLDVVLDELERRETKEDAAVQVEARDGHAEDAAAQTEDTKMDVVDTETQTLESGDQGAVFELLQALEKELKSVELKNSELEKQLETQILKNKEEVEGKEDGRVESCLQTLQRGVDAMNWSCSCVDYPLALFTGEEDQREDSRVTCVDLEHQLEAQALRLEHVQDCLYMWRDAVVQFMKRQQESESASGLTFPLNASTARRGEEHVGEMNCAAALRGALSQLRHHFVRQLGRRHDGDQQMLKDLAAVLAKDRSGAKTAAKMVHKWAGWEAKHLEEMHALRRGFAKERAVALSRRMALLKRIDQLEQRELDLQAEVNTEMKHNNYEDLAPLSRSNKPTELLLGNDKCSGHIEYPQLMIRLATAEQSLLAKDEQLAAANDTIRALSLCAPISRHTSNEQISEVYSTEHLSPMNRLAMELQRTTKEKLEFFRRREKDLLNVGQYFRMEKSCLQLQSRLETEQKHAAVLEAAKLVSERERDELEMKVEKLEMEALLLKMTRGSSDAQLLTSLHNDNGNLANDTLGFYQKRLRLVEGERKVLRDRLRHYQQQDTLRKHYKPTDHRGESVTSQKLDTNIFESVVEHHRTCVSEFKEFLVRQHACRSSTTVPNGDEDTLRQASDCEFEVLLHNYEALWIAFHAMYLLLAQVPQQMKSGAAPYDFDAECDYVLRTFGCKPIDESNSDGVSLCSERILHLEREISRRDEKILILQQRLLDSEECLSGHGNSTTCSHDDDGCQLEQHESAQSSINATRSDFSYTRGGHNSVEFVGSGSMQDTNPLMHDASQLSGPVPPILSLLKPQEPSRQPDRISSNGFGNETIVHIADCDADEKVMGDRVLAVGGTAGELEECLAKCAHLASQNTKLTRRLRVEKASNKQFAEEQEKLRLQLTERTETNSELQQTLEKYRDAASTIRCSSLDGTVKSEEETQSVGAVADVNAKKSAQEQQYEVLREQLASREQENLTLVQALCAIKEKCAQMEVIHQKELRMKAAEHAEGIESYMTTVNGTLSRIESDKHRLEDENAHLRAKLQQLAEERSRIKLENSQRNSKGTNTDHESQTFDLAAYTQEKESLMDHIQDLELQLTRERKLTEVVEQNKQLENQQEEQQETNAKMDVFKAKQDYELRCETLQAWRTKLQHEFTEYQEIQLASQQESDKRIEFLSACIEEFVRLTDATQSAAGNSVSTKELYDAVMELARDPPRIAGREFTSSLQSKTQAKQRLSASRGHQQGGPNKQTPSQTYSWDNVLDSKKQDETELSETLWWKLRASKLEAYVRSAMLQNDTFEDTIRQLELGMNDVKEELSRRLAREAQLVSKLGSLKAELASTKEQAASLAEKYQLVNAELEKRQGEATSRGDETQRARMAVQRKTELLLQQKAKVISLQQELEQVTKKLERLAVAEKQAALLQQKAKEHTQQLLHARQSYERCSNDNIQLALHLEKMKERHTGILARLKAARAENTQLRAQISEVKSIAKAETQDTGNWGSNKGNYRGNQAEVDAVSITSLIEEARALKRRVLQKQDVIVSYKAKLSDYEAQLERQRETMVKLAHTNRELQQGQRQRQQQDMEYTAALHAKLESQLDEKQGQLDGLRASVYDSFEAFVFCQPVISAQPLSSPYTAVEIPLIDEVRDEDKLFEIKRWTDFSATDLEELRLAGRPRLSRRNQKNEADLRTRNKAKRKAATAALRQVEGALEANPEDCRAEICDLLQCLCGHSGE